MVFVSQERVKAAITVNLRALETSGLASLNKRCKTGQTPET